MRNRILFLLVCLAAAFNANARTFYVSAAGNNTASGLTPSTAWQTIAKVNSSFSSIAAGDTILFRRGDTFYGTLVIGKSGTSAAPIVFGAYGTGAKPVISGFVRVSSWSVVANGVYQSTVAGLKSTLNMVTVNNKPQALGRFPNADAPNAGHLKYESFSGATSITDNELSSSPNWAGAEVVIRKKLWVIDRCKVTAHSGTSLTFTNTNNSTYDGTNGYGYFFQNDARTLDQQGEWYYNPSTRVIQMYFGSNSPTSYTVNASGLDTLVFLSSRSFITLTNLAFEGANANAMLAINSNDIRVIGCDFTHSGVGAINMLNVSNVLIDACTTNYSLSNAIFINSTRASGVTIRNCQVKNTGTLPGMGLSSGNSYKGIYANVSNNLLMEFNRVDTTGYVGLEFQGNNVTVRNNVVNYFNYVKDDAGGIYCYTSGTDANPGTSYTNRVVRDNIVMNGIGEAKGRFSTKIDVAGIFLDGRAHNTDILNNTTFNCGTFGIYTNNPHNVTIRGNTTFDNESALGVMRYTWSSVRNLNVKGNIFYPKAESQKTFYYTDAGVVDPVLTNLQGILQELGNVDSNTYSTWNQVPFAQEVYSATNGAFVPSSPLSLEGWRSVSGLDAASVRPAKMPVTHKVNSLIGANKFTNGLFSSSISGITLFATNVTATWDNTGKISGGSLRLNFSSPTANRYATLHSPIGAVSAARKYILRFSTFGTTQNGIIRAFIRKTTSPFNDLTPRQVKSFGLGRKDHEFLFSAPTTDAGGSFVIEVEQNSGTTYIDNVEFFEADATLYDVNNQWLFEYNDTRTAKTIPLTGIFTAPNGTVYTSSITLQPYTSVILVKDTSSRLPLKAAVTATNINCNGGNSTVTVTATGGTQPYTGTGVFQVKAGTFTFIVTDATGARDSVTIIIDQPLEPLKATATAGTILVIGGSTTVTVAATGGTAPYTGTGSFSVTAGTYTYTVTDAKGCTASTTITINEMNGPLGATASPATVNVPCFNGTANVTITASGGRSPYVGAGTVPVSAGRGSLRLAFPNAGITNNFTLLYSTIGPISSSKNYVLKFTTLGSTANGRLRAALRQTTTPWTVIVPRQTGTFGAARKEHTFLFQAPPTQTAASFLIEIDQASGTTFIDNIACFEANAEGVITGNNLYGFGQFERGLTPLILYSFNGNHTAVWDTTGKITNISYYTVTDALNASTVVAVNTTQPAAPLRITATATAVSATTGTATVSVSATGGTAPYTGTGSFTVAAGTYTYTVRDAAGCSSSVTIRASSTPVTVSARPLSPGTQDVLASEPAPLTLTAWPNPSNASFNLRAEGGTPERIQVVVYSFDGRIVQQLSGTTWNRFTIGDQYPPGVYTIKVIQGKQSVLTKVIKTNK